MFSLNTLRTKFGAVLTVVIVLALLAFILSLGPEMGFLGSSDPTVGVIDGNKVGYMEYLNTYETVKTSNNGSESTEEQAALAAAMTLFSQSITHLEEPVVPEVNSMTAMRCRSLGVLSE